MIITPFITQLEDHLKQRDLCESSITSYIRTLINLHNKIEGNEKIKNLNFLIKTDLVEENIKDYKDNTKKTIYNTLCSILYPHKDKKKYKITYNFYKEKSEDINKEIKSIINENIKSKKENENWITWDEVMDIKTKLEEESETDKKYLNEKQYNLLLHNVVLSLYVNIPPRRNEYLKLNIIAKKEHATDDKNYFVYDEDLLILRDYKTSKKYGSIDIEINENLKKDIHNYLKYHKIFNSSKKKKKYEVPFFVNHQGVEIISNNAITRILNKIFNKNIGATMLRHIYLTDKYGKELEDRKEDADKMGHSLNMQTDYIKSGVSPPYDEDE